MYRRCITTLVMFGFVAGQWAAVPHAHGATSPAEQRQHDAHPHFHFGFWGHSHDHGHAARDEHEKSLPQRGEDVNCSPFDDHDADAIYLPATVVVALASGGHRNETSDALTVVAGFVLPSARLASDDEGAVVRCHPPDEGPADCPLFLKLRTLRI